MTGKSLLHRRMIFVVLITSLASCKAAINATSTSNTPATTGSGADQPSVNETPIITDPKASNASNPAGWKIKPKSLAGDLLFEGGDGQTDASYRLNITQNHSGSLDLSPDDESHELSYTGITCSDVPAFVTATEDKVTRSLNLTVIPTTAGEFSFSCRVIVDGSVEQPPFVITLIVHETPCTELAPGMFRGAGSIEDPYQICKTEQLVYLSEQQQLWDKNFKLVADLNLAGFTKPLGFRDNNHLETAKPFSGSFDGASHVLTGLRLEADGTVDNYSVALFAYLHGATVHDLVIRDAVVKLEKSRHSGVFAGHVVNSKIRNITIENTILERLDEAKNGGERTAVFVGVIFDAAGTDRTEIESIRINASIKARDSMAVGIGFMILQFGSSAKVSDMVISGSLQSRLGNTSAAAMAYIKLMNASSIEVTDVHNHADVEVVGITSGNWSGIWGGTLALETGSNAVFKRISNSGNWLGDPTLGICRGWVGGIFGTAQFSASTGVFSDIGSIGNLTIPNINNHNYNGIGGLFGNIITNTAASVSVTRAYFRGAIHIGGTGVPSNIGGLVGQIASTVGDTLGFDQTYASFSYTGATPAANTKAALVGVAPASSLGTTRFTMTNTYFNSALLAVSVNDTAPRNGVPGFIVDATNDQLKQAATFLGWDFAQYWRVNEGIEMPTLRY